MVRRSEREKDEVRRTSTTSSAITTRLAGRTELGFTARLSVRKRTGQGTEEQKKKKTNENNRRKKEEEEEEEREKEERDRGVR
jgi:hypothetical protein